MSDADESAKAWRVEVLAALQGMHGLLARLVVLVEHPVRVAERPELPVEKEPVAAIPEPPVAEEPLATWILTDERVAQVERAIEQEQRVRGRVYGGSPTAP